MVGMTRKMWAVVLATVAGAGLLPTAASAAQLPAAAVQATASPRARAMWLWSQADPAAVVTWAHQQGVKEIFAAVPWLPSPAELARLKDLRARTRAAGIRLSALGGDAAWAVNPRDAVAWRQRETATKLFDGIHLDVEPYLLPAWTTNQPAIAASYLSMLDAVRRAGPEPLEADVPFWLATIKTAGGNLAEAVLQRVDAITVMSYRDSGTAVVGVGTDLLTRAQSSRKPVRLAAETQPLADCPYCTFAGQSATALRTQLAAIDSGAQRYATYTGIAVHDYDSWTRLR
jgi:hypothetical protein